MAKLKLKFTRAELLGFGTYFFTALQLSQTYDLYNAGNYCYWYNVKSLQQKIISKLCTCDISRAAGKFTVQLNVNEYEALKWLYNSTIDVSLLDAYYSVLMRDIFTRLHKQEIILSHKSNFVNLENEQRTINSQS